jgi:hypothetical protein
MTPEMLWSAALSAVMALIGWVLKNHTDEVQRLQILLNRTREEMAKEYVTKAEVHADINRVIARIDNLDAKIDRILQGMNK